MEMSFCLSAGGQTICLMDGVTVYTFFCRSPKKMRLEVRPWKSPRALMAHSYRQHLQPHARPHRLTCISRRPIRARLSLPGGPPAHHPSMLPLPLRARCQTDRDSSPTTACKISAPLQPDRCQPDCYLSDTTACKVSWTKKSLLDHIRLRRHMNLSSSTQQFFDTAP